MYEIWYASSHGFGHITRVMANLEKKLAENKEYFVILISGKFQIAFAKFYLKKYEERLIFREILTDIGLINKPSSLEVDKEALKKKLYEFIDSWEDLVNKEVKFLKDYTVGEIFVDISPIGVLTAKALNKKCRLVSNFTWYQQYKFLGLDPELTEKYLELDQKIDILYRYPLHLDFSHMNAEIKNTDFISREISQESIRKIKEEYGESIFISCGKSAELGKVKINNFYGTVFATAGFEVENTHGKTVNLPVDVMDTQNYIAASEFIISKAGWGTIAEAVCTGTPMILLERDSVLEDSHNIREVKKIANAISKKIEECREIDYLKLKEELYRNGEKFKDIYSRA